MPWACVGLPMCPCERGGRRGRERKRQRQRERQRERQRDRERQRQRDRERDREPKGRGSYACENEKGERCKQRGRCGPLTRLYFSELPTLPLCSESIREVSIVAAGLGFVIPVTSNPVLLYTHRSIVQRQQHAMQQIIIPFRHGSGLRCGHSIHTHSDADTDVHARITTHTYTHTHTHTPTYRDLRNSKS